jgi:phosphate acetyltransferase
MKFIDSVFEKLQRHPKRIIFPEGNDIRILTAAQEYVRLKLGAAVVLGERAEIEKTASESGISLSHILIIEPSKGDDMDLFVDRLETLGRYRGIDRADGVKILSNPNYYGTMMLQNGQADGLVAGASEFSGNILRPLFQLIKPLPGIRSISSCVVMDTGQTEIGDEGTIFFADAGVIPSPSVEQLADIAVETARLRRQLTGRRPRVAMLSYSTKGSAQTKDTERIVAATALARQKLREFGIDADIDGELQVDAAIFPDIAKRKAPESSVAGRADVLIFPDLHSGNISTKLLQHVAKVPAYGQILLGLSKPAAELSRGATVEEILGVAAVVALQAIEYRKLYPDQASFFGAP